MLGFLSNIYYLFANGQKIQELALSVEDYARKLNDLASEESSTADVDVVSVLKSSRMLLERFVENRKALEEAQEENSPEPEDDRVEVSKDPKIGDFNELLDLPGKVDNQENESLAEPQPPDLPAAVEPSATAKEIIKLRDWLFVAKSRDAAPTVKTLEILYGKLGKTLSKEGIKPLEETGIFDENRQSAVDKINTNDPAKNNLVSDTIRPGYLFNDEIFRPQEVVVYVYRED